MLGALNAMTHELVMVTNDSYINAHSVCELLRKLAALNLGIPITLVLDNARYQKCRLVWAVAKELNIELLYLPAYSPNPAKPEPKIFVRYSPAIPLISGNPVTNISLIFLDRFVAPGKARHILQGESPCRERCSNANL